MSGLDRWYWAAVAVIAYVGVASVPGGGAWWLRLLMPVGAPLALAWFWLRTQRAPSTADVDPSSQLALRLCAAGATIWLQSRLGPPQQPALELAAALACGVCAVSATYSLARIPGRPGLLKPPKSALSVDAAAFTGLLWGAASTVAAARLLVPSSTLPLDPLTLDYAATAAAIGSLLVLIAAAWRVRVVRELEMGVGDRAAAALALAVTALSVAVPVAALDVAAPDRALPAAVCIASLCCVWTVVVPDASRVSRTLRGTLAVMMLGVPVALIAAVASQQATAHAGSIALAGCAGALLVGLIAREVARPLGPEQSRWLSAIAEASQKALTPEPNAAVVATLQALKQTSASPNAKPQLWRLDPPSVMSIDVAGYLIETEAEVPIRVCDLGIDEPERTLRVETLQALQVRRPDIRDLLEWFEIRAAFSATVVVDDDGPAGFLLLPRGDRRSIMTLEEARAVRLLADRISALFSVTAALARARKREGEARASASHFEAEYGRLRRVTQGESERHTRFAKALARPLLTAAYSAATRLALVELERLSADTGGIVLLTPLGVDATAWAAVSHLSGVTRGGPFLLVDSATEQDTTPERWSGDESVLALVRGGSLFIRDLHLLPLVLQDALAETLTAQTVQDSELPAAKLIVSLTEPVELLLQDGRLSKALGSMLSQRVLTLPSLVDRAEDLRSLVLDLVARFQRPSGEPLGIERRALQALLDHTWPGNETELQDVVGRAAQHCQGARLDLEDLQAAAFTGLSAEPFASVSMPGADVAQVAGPVAGQVAGTGASRAGAAGAGAAGVVPTHPTSTTRATSSPPSESPRRRRPRPPRRRRRR